MMRLMFLVNIFVGSLYNLEELSCHYYVLEAVSGQATT